MAQSRRSRRAINAILIMAEGDHDQAFVRHLKDEFGRGDRGFCVQIKNAHGKGADNVIRRAQAQKRQGGFVKVAAFFDTDTGWSAEVRAAAKGIILLPSDPCLEAMLLRIAEQEFKLGDDLKKLLAPLVNLRDPLIFDFNISGLIV